MPETNHANMPWADIVPPNAVTTSVDVTMAALAVVALVISLVLAYFYWRHPKQQARRFIKSLTSKKQYQTDRGRDSCHLIAKELGKAFGVTRLSAVRFPDIRQQEWEAFLQRLDQNRFSAITVSGDELGQLAQQAMSWLKARQWNT